MSAEKTHTPHDFILANPPSQFPSPQKSGENEYINKHVLKDFSDLEDLIYSAEIEKMAAESIVEGGNGARIDYYGSDKKGAENEKSARKGH